MMKINWQRLRKSVFAAFVGSWLGSALFIGVSGLIGMGIRFSLNEVWHGALSFFRLLFSPLGLLAFIPMLVIGLPVQALLQRSGKTGYLWNVIPAVIAGAILFPLVLISVGALAKGDFTPENMGMGAMAAFLVGSITWLVRRPDRDSANGQDSAKQAKDV